MAQRTSQQQPEISDLIGRIRQDDATAFEQLYTLMWEPLYVFALKRLGATADAEDVVQEVFTNIWLRRHSLQINATVEAYLFTAVRYQTINQLRRILQSPEKLDQVNEAILPSTEAAFRNLLARETAAIINREVEQLPGKMREIYLLSVEQNRSVAEIATGLELSEQTVRNQLNLARTRIRKSLRAAYMLLVFPL
ncbi:MAG: sigma-70 family RNA polymerase sigma factor [Candidatus Pseudobacter hemicellulosilyticus]|uniref:Sigma-70 family RNA polymerase sigma factor n=1 Tax=Candidatus Pseudobacter hemicellulosilyticus TaxID=3121375 RepID=A0AAJ6BG52_9BACT|nr:MAG: sigma-70 family RNA polymerase sigma factor [Pseudobacter sp.]